MSKQLRATAAMMAPLTLVLLWTAANVGADEKQDAKQADNSKAAVKKAAKPKGRLPAYYGAVVSGEQRERIYAVQAKYANQIKALEAELLALIKKRNAEVEAVLTPEQLARVEQLRAEAKKKAAARRAQRLKAGKLPSKDAAAKPPKKKAG